VREKERVYTAAYCNPEARHGVFSMRVPLLHDDRSSPPPPPPPPLSASMDAWCAALPPHRPSPPLAHSTLHRYTLAVFALLTTNQTIFWFSFSSAPAPVNAYFGTSDADLDLLLNWGPIVFLPVCPLVAYILRRSTGLNTATRCGALMCFIACAIRSIPCLLPPPQRRSSSAHLLLHAGQIINAAVGPIVMSSPSLLSARWFPPHRRATATSLAYLGGNLGGAVGFLLGP
jgi:hypothetical protein